MNKVVARISSEKKEVSQETTIFDEKMKLRLIDRCGKSVRLPKDSVLETEVLSKYDPKHDSKMNAWMKKVEGAYINYGILEVPEGVIFGEKRLLSFPQFLIGVKYGDELLSTMGICLKLRSYQKLQVGNVSILRTEKPSVEFEKFHINNKYKRDLFRIADKTVRATAKFLEDTCPRIIRNAKDMVMITHSGVSNLVNRFKVSAYGDKNLLEKTSYELIKENFPLHQQILFEKDPAIFKVNREVFEGLYASYNPKLDWKFYDGHWTTNDSFHKFNSKTLEAYQGGFGTGEIPIDSMNTNSKNFKNSNKQDSFDRGLID